MVPSPCNTMVEVHEAMSNDRDFEDAFSYALIYVGKKDHSSSSSSRKRMYYVCKENARTGICDLIVADLYKHGM